MTRSAHAAPVTCVSTKTRAHSRQRRAVREPAAAGSVRTRAPLQGWHLQSAPATHPLKNSCRPHQLVLREGHTCAERARIPQERRWRDCCPPRARPEKPSGYEQGEDRTASPGKYRLRSVVRSCFAETAACPPCGGDSQSHSQRKEKRTSRSPATCPHGRPTPSRKQKSPFPASAGGETRNPPPAVAQQLSHPVPSASPPGAPAPPRLAAGDVPPTRPADPVTVSFAPPDQTCMPAQSMPHPSPLITHAHCAQGQDSGPVSGPHWAVLPEPRRWRT